MKRRYDSRSYRIEMQYGNADLNRIIDELAVQTIRKCAGEFGVRSPGVKKALLPDKLSFERWQHTLWTILRRLKTS